MPYPTATTSPETDPDDEKEVGTKRSRSTALPSTRPQARGLQDLNRQRYLEAVEKSVTAGRLYLQLRKAIGQPMLGLGQTFRADPTPLPLVRRQPIESRFESAPSTDLEASPPRRPRQPRARAMQAWTHELPHGRSRRGKSHFLGIVRNNDLERAASACPCWLNKEVSEHRLRCTV